MALGGVSWPSLPTFFPSCLRPAAYSANCDFFRGLRLETCVVFERRPAIWTRHNCAPPIWRGDGFLEPVVFRDVESVSCFYPFRDRRFRILRVNPFLRNIIFRVRSRTHRFPRGDIGRYQIYGLLDGRTDDGRISGKTMPGNPSPPGKSAKKGVWGGHSRTLPWTRFALDAFTTASDSAIPGGREESPIGACSYYRAAGRRKQTQKFWFELPDK